MAFGYRIIDGELTCKEFNGDMPEGWWKEDAKFSADSKAKAKAAYLASKSGSAPNTNKMGKK